MITFECVADGCSQKNVKIDFFGDIAQAECGGCATTLQSKDLRPDPELPPSTLNLDLETTQE
jgi:hypothetical protein